ncbi:MAG: pantoate--beta-alanine ligase [Anaerolineales bacterium]|jgi:pantoate--beta-alanine ligase
MRIVQALSELRAARASLPSPFGLVPTMGALHEGHLSLVRRAKEECASVGVSIFVNPTQFAPEEDLDAYPRDLTSDAAMLEAVGADLVWAPSEKEVYPPGFQTWVTVEDLTKPLEGAHREGHFQGVTTVVAKLFNAFQPNNAYFGQKDAQQALVVKRMARDLDYPLEVIVCPTVREPDGLAMSSRNAYLDEQQRKAATALWRALRAAVEAFDSGERDAEALRRLMVEMLEKEPLARTQYVSVADCETLDELTGAVESALLSMAVFVGKTRLIDNMVVGQPGW